MTFLLHKFTEVYKSLRKFTEVYKSLRKFTEVYKRFTDVLRWWKNILNMFATSPLAIVFPSINSRVRSQQAMMLEEPALGMLWGTVQPPPCVHRPKDQWHFGKELQSHQPDIQQANTQTMTYNDYVHNATLDNILTRPPGMIHLPRRTWDLVVVERVLHNRCHLV